MVVTLGGLMDLVFRIIDFFKKVNKKYLILISILVVLTGILIFYSLQKDDEPNPNYNVINKAQVAKSVSMLFHTMEELNENEGSEFQGQDAAWYHKYMNMMYTDSYYSIKDIQPIEREALDAFTYGDLEKLYTNMGVVDRELLSYVKNNRSNSPIILKEWNEIYGLMVEKLDINDKIEKVNLIISGTISRDSSLPQWTATTTYGKVGFEGLSVDYYIDKGITVFIKDNEILGVADVYSEDVIYHNSWIISMSGGNIKAYVEGCIREFIYNDKVSNYSNVVADLSVKDGNLVEAVFKTNTVNGKVLQTSKTEIDLEGVGTYSIDDDCRVYKIYGNISMCNMSEVLVGYDAQRFILDGEGKICAVIIDRDVQATNIRVILNTTGFNGLFHDSVTVVAKEGMRITCGSETFEVEANKEYVITPDSELAKSGRIKITSKGLDGKVGITTIERGYGTPYYRGTIEITLREGKLMIINELPLEEYLYSVVPSEMPWSYNYEALKAQAICARSFAYKHVMSNSYSEYGAHVDDSTTYQVYNNSEEQTVSNSAVDETYGQVLTYGEEVISAYFYSTSCGATTTSAVWGSDYPYTYSTVLNVENQSLNLKNETIFDSFIRTNYKTYDSEYPWYRWKVTMSLKKLTSAINEQIGTLSAENVQILNDKGVWVNKKISSVGQVKKIETGERGEGGVLKYITIFGTDATVRVYKEYNIRKILSPNGIAIKRGTGDEVTTMTMLPSGFFVLDEETENNLLSGYTFVGGGYGHGVGMSQNGANAMAKLGLRYDEILHFFYKDVEVSKKY